jgi:hypothetical protein
MKSIAQPIIHLRITLPPWRNVNHMIVRLLLISPHGKVQLLKSD